MVKPQCCIYTLTVAKGIQENMNPITTGKLRKKDAKQMVILQIGENDFNISRENLRRLGGEFTERVCSLPRETYFLDRNGDLFQYILQYLRSGDIFFPDDFKDGERLTKEAAFYGLKDLEEHLKKGAGRPEIVTIMLMTPHEVEEKPEDQKVMLIHVKVTSGEGVREWVGPNSLPKEKRAAGTDVILHWSSESSAPNTEWKTVTEKLLDEFNCKVFKCEGIEKYHISVAGQWILERMESTLKDEMKTTGTIETISRDFVFNIKDENMNQFIDCFLCSGFTLMSDKYSSSTSRFNKEYQAMREIKFQRVKPVQ